MSHQQGQLHLIRTMIQLKKVSITVKFPCSISFALKNQNNVVQHKGVYELVKGQSIINQSIDIQVQVPFIRGRYQQKKLSLMICMVSANGRIPAGTVTINPTEKVIIDKKSPLQKCPDKNAEVTLTESFQRLRVIKQITQMNTQRNNLTASTVSGYNYLNRSQVNYTSTANLFRNQSEAALKQFEQNKMEKMDYSTYRNTDVKSLRNSQVGSEGERRNFNKFSKNKVEQSSKRSIYGTNEKDNVDMRMSRASNKVAEGLQWEVQSQKSKIIKLEQEKTGYIKQIVKLRGSMVRVDSQQRFQIEDQYKRVNTQKSQLEEQVEKLKEKTKYQQKRQRQSGSLLKDLKDELDKRKSRIIQLDTTRNQIQGQLSQKDKMISTLQSEKRKLQQSLQQEKALQQSFLKRLDLKQNSYKDQLKKITDKYSQSEAERQKAMLDYNNLLLQIQNSQKRNQTIIRQKQKASNEQKAKLNKKIEQLLSQITDLQEKLSQKINLVRDYEYYKKKAAQEEKQNAEKYIDLKEKYEDTAIQAKNLQIQKKSLLQELKNVENSINQEKIGFKKKYMDALNQLNILKQKLQKSSIQNNTLDSRVKDLELQLQKQKNQKVIANSKLQELKKAQKKYLQDEQARERMAETLSMQSITQNNKLGEFKIKLESQRKKYENMETKYEEQVQYLVKSKDQLQNQIDDLKWVLQKEVQKYQTIVIKHREANEQIIQLNQQIIKNQQKFMTFQEQKGQLNTKIQKLQMQITHLQAKNKTLSESLKKRQLQYYSMQKKGSSYEQEFFVLQTQLENTINDLNQKIVNLERTVQSKTNQLKEKDQQLIIMNQQFYALKAVQSKQNNQISIKNNEIISLKESNQAIQQDFTLLLNKNEKLQTQISEKQQNVQDLSNKLRSVSSQLQQKCRQNQKRKLQYKDYRQTIRNVLSSFFNFWNKEQYIEPKQLQLLPDQQLSKLQSECAKKIYLNNRRQLEKIKDLSQNAAYLQQDIKKLKKQILLSKKDHESKINLQIHSQKTIKVQKQQQINALNQRISQLTNLFKQKNNQSEFLSSSVSKYEQMISQFTEQSVRNHQSQSELKDQINRLQKQIFQFKEKQLINKLMASNESQQLNHLIKQQRKRHQDELKSLNQAIIGKDRQLKQKNEQIKKWAFVESQLKLQQVKYVQQIKQLNLKLSDQLSNTNTVQKIVHDKERVIKQLNQEIINARSSLQIQRTKQKQSQEQINRLQNQINDLQLKLKMLEQQQRYKNSTTQQGQKKQREKRQKTQGMRLKLEQQNKQIRQKCIKLQSQIQFYKFYKEESSRKLSQYQKMKEDTFMQMLKSKQSTIKLQKQIGAYQNKVYKYEMEIQHLSKQKQLAVQSINKFRQKIEDYETQAQEYSNALNQLQCRDIQIARLQENIKFYQQQNNKLSEQLRISTAKYKQQIAEKTNRIRELQNQLDNRHSDMNIQRQKIITQYENEKNMYQIKLQTYEQNMRVLQQQMQFQKQQATKQIQGANSIIQELNEVIRQKQQNLQSRQQIINEQNVRLQQLNLQIVECVNKWQREKQVYVPASSKINEINEQLIRMNKFMSELDGRNKQLLQVNKRKMQQTLQNKPSITQILKEFYILMQKSKNKILNRCQTQKQKESVMLQFKAVQQKLDLTLKSTQIVTTKQ